MILRSRLIDSLRGSIRYSCLMLSLLLLMTGPASAHLSATSNQFRQLAVDSSGIREVEHQVVWQHEFESELIYKRARMLANATDTFTRRDPQEYSDGTDLYLPLRGNPMRYRDFLGTKCENFCDSHYTPAELTGHENPRYKCAQGQGALVGTGDHNSDPAHGDTFDDRSFQCLTCTAHCHGDACIYIISETLQGDGNGNIFTHTEVQCSCNGDIPEGWEEYHPPKPKGPTTTSGPSS